jgi:putative ABC transport system permease protein
VAAAAVRGLVALGPESIPRVESISLDGRVLALTLAATCVTGLLFGLVPAFQGNPRDLTAALRGGDRSASDGRGRTRVRAVLVASEVALALVLLVGAGLMIRSFRALQAIDPGFDPSNVHTMVVSVAGSREAAPGRRAIYFSEVVRRVRALPGVESASAINHIPIAGDEWGTPFHVEGRPAPAPGEELAATYRVTLPGYFPTMRVPLLRGRDFTAADELGAPRVAIVNEELASRHWPGQNPIGKRITLGHPDGDAEWLTVVGVSKNAVRSDWSARHEPEIYVPYLQDRGYLQRPGSHYAFLTLVIRASCASGGECDAGALAPGVRRAVWALDPGVPIAEEQTMNDVVRSATAGTRFNLLLLGTFAAVALVLAAVGIYGVMSYVVSLRTREIGIRIALGATRTEVLRMVVWQGVAVAAVGAAAGWLGALAISRLMDSLLYEVSATDPTTFALVPLVLGAVAAVASYLPARRATRVDPLVALRQE